MNPLLLLPFATDLRPIADGLNQLPTNWYGLAAVAILVGTPAAIGVWQTHRSGSKLGEVKNTVDNVKDQVTNGHRTNLRDDLTLVIQRLGLLQSWIEKQPTAQDFKDLRREVRGDLGQLRSEVGDLEKKFEERECRGPCSGEQQTGDQRK